MTFDLTNDDGVAVRQRRQSQLKWDRKKKKFVKGDGGGADNVKLVRTESGTRLPISYRSGRFDEWKNAHRRSLPGVGEAEPESARQNTFNGGRKFRHNKMTEPRQRDKYSDAPQRRGKEPDAGETTGQDNNGFRKGRGPGGRYGTKPIGKVKNELKTVEQIRRTRNLMAKRKEKNARPSRRKGKR